MVLVNQQQKNHHTGEGAKKGLRKAKQKKDSGAPLGCYVDTKSAELEGALAVALASLSAWPVGPFQFEPKPSLPSPPVPDQTATGKSPKNNEQFVARVNAAAEP